MLETFHDQVLSIESRVSRIEKQGFLEYAKTRKGFEETIYFSKEEYNGKVQNMDPWSMDPLHGPGPSKYGPGPWTPFMDRVHGPPIFITPKITD